MKQKLAHLPVVFGVLAFDYANDLKCLEEVGSTLDKSQFFASPYRPFRRI